MGFRVLFMTLLALLAVPAQASDHTARHEMVATANPHATEAAYSILRQGGSAVDAAIAAQMVLTLVEPQSSGIGGGAFLMAYDAGTGNITAFDGREKAPSDVDEKLFLKTDGTPEEKRNVIPGGRSVGVPGVVRMLKLAHDKYGKLPWAALFQPAIKLAREGFRVSPRLHMLLDQYQELKQFPAAAAYFYTPDGKPLPVGHLLRNPALAETLETIARDPEAFYKGPIAHDIISAVQSSPINPGTLSLKDIAGYEAKARQPVCGLYKVWKLCGMPPPSSGGVAVIQIMKILQGFDLAAMKPDTPASVNLISEAERLAYADRARWLGDSDFVDVPLKGLVSTAYLADRRKLITPGKIMAKAPAGMPPGANAAYRQVEPAEIPSTTHFSIVDRWGDVIAMTSSVESAFGSHLMVRGFMLNNELTDFSFAPVEDGRIVANSVEPDKRPLSSMSPTLVFDGKDRPVMSVGSPGGPLIISFVAKTLIGVLDWGMPIQQAIALPNYIYYGDSLIVERDSALTKIQPELEAMGYKIKPSSLASGLQGVMIHYDKQGRWLEGGADPRREGTVAGD